MIRTSAIANAIGQRLLTLDPVLPVAWPNKDVPAGTAHPYLVFDLVPVSRTDDTLSGGAAVATGFAQVTVMSEINTFATSATDLAEDVAALFPYTLRLPITGGELTITQPPEVMQGYPDGPHWRTPVKITYEAS